MGILYGEYEILEELPSWTTGTVYRARHRTTGEMGAVKVMDMFEIDQKDRERFYTTASQAAELRHKNIGRILDVCRRIDTSTVRKGEEKETAYIVQEFVQGTSLDKVLKEQGAPFMPQLAFYIVEQVVQGLQAGYSRQIPHRNLTMSNIILKRDGQIKLVDYGIGRLFSSGTIFYMSPEDVAGEEISEKTEIFTVGVILFEMLMGTRPFEGDNFGQLMNKIMGGAYNREQMNEIPEFMRSIVERCLQKNPDERYEDFTELLDTIKQCQKSPKLFALNKPLKETIADTEEEKPEAGRSEDEEIRTDQISEPESAQTGETAHVPVQSETETRTGQAEVPESLPEPEPELEPEPEPEPEFEPEPEPEAIAAEEKEEGAEAAEQPQPELQPASDQQEQAETGAEGQPAEEPAAAEANEGITGSAESDLQDDREEDMSGIIENELEQMEQEDFPSTGKIAKVQTSGSESETSVSFDDPFLQMIADVPMFKGLDQDSITHFSSVLKTRSFTDGTEIITQGGPGENLYVILDGTVAVIQQDSDENELELTELGEGDCFGEMSLLTGEPCSATIRSKGPSTLLSLYKDDFQLMLAEYPTVSAHFNRILIKRLRNTNLKFENEIEQGVSGKLSAISLTDLIQTIFLGQKTGKLLLARRRNEAHILFREGNITGVTCGGREGEDAFYTVLEWDDGTFRFVQDEQGDVRENIATDTNALLMEGMRRLDECAKLTDYLGDTKRIFYIERELREGLDALELSSSAKKIASLFNGIDTVEEIIQKNDDFRLESLEAIIELYTKDLLLPV